eukprot:294830-Pelagomonas_calceolata.AAC.4
MLDTVAGQEVSVDETFWMSIVRQLDITPEQMQDLVAAQGLFGACHHKNVTELKWDMLTMQ